MADDTAALIRALRYRRADVLGWSMGGNIAEMLALRHPDVIHRLVLAATDPGGPHAVLPTNPLAVKILNNPHVTNDEVLKAIFPQSKPGVTAKLSYVKRLFRWPNVNQNDFNASAAIVRQQSIAEGKGLWYCSTCGAYAGLPSIRIHTLIADGAQDIVEPPRNSQIIASRIPNETLILFGGAGHAFLFQFNATFAERVNRFLS
jgi:pimeloyl-ACP methyl ester carboxylesterase